VFVRPFSFAAAYFSVDSFYAVYYLIFCATLWNS